MTITEELARFIVKTNLETMPTEVVEITINAMIDTIGVALMGSVSPVGKIITTFVGKLGDKPVATVIAGKFRTSSCNAALANGCMAHALDYDDAGASTQGHPSAVLMPVTLALGEEIGASGRNIIEAYVLGVEIWGRIARAMRDSAFKGWHPTGVFGTLGAATAAAKLLKLNEEQTAMALGLSASEAAGLGQNIGSMTKPLHAGNAAKNGIVAAILAKENVTAAKDVIEGKMGFTRAFYWGNTVDLSKITENLGSPLCLVSQRIHVKKYPTCYATHRSLDAILHMINSYDINPDDVETVDCQVSAKAVQLLFYTNPRTGNEVGSVCSLSWRQLSPIEMWG